MVETGTIRAMCTTDSTLPRPGRINEGASELLSRVLNELDTHAVSVGDLSRKFSHRSFGGVIAVLALLGMIPGISFVAGAIIMVIGIQMMGGTTTPVLPGLLTRRTIKVERLRKLLAKPTQYLIKLETIIKPRWSAVFHPGCYRLLGALVFLLALAMISPLPLSNLLPALALIHLSLGFLEHDGVAIVTGLITSAIALISSVVLLMLAIELANEIWSR